MRRPYSLGKASLSRSPETRTISKCSLRRRSNSRTTISVPPCCMRGYSSARAIRMGSFYWSNSIVTAEQPAGKLAEGWLQVKSEVRVRTVGQGLESAFRRRGQPTLESLGNRPRAGGGEAHGAFRLPRISLRETDSCTPSLRSPHGLADSSKTPQGWPVY